MKTSTEIASIAKHVGEHKAVELCAKAGFDGWDFSMFQMGLYNWSTRSLEPSDHPSAWQSVFEICPGTAKNRRR